MLAIAMPGFCFAQVNGAESLFRFNEVVSPVMGTSIPRLEIRDPERCGYFGLQYGPGTNEVAYVILDYNSDKGIYDTLSVYVPDHPRYGNVLKLKGSRRHEGSVQFKSFVLDTSFDDTKASLDVEIAADGLLVKIAADCRLSRKNSEVCRFSVNGPLSFRAGLDRPAHITPLLGPVKVTCRLDHRSNPASVAGRLKMGSWNLIPLTGRMPCRLSATVVDENDKLKIKEKTRLDEAGEGKFRFTPYRPLIPGRSYKAQVRVDLGPVLGTIETSARLTPKRQ